MVTESCSQLLKGTQEWGQGKAWPSEHSFVPFVPTVAIASQSSKSHSTRTPKTKPRSRQRDGPLCVVRVSVVKPERRSKNHGEPSAAQPPPKRRGPRKNGRTATGQPDVCPIFLTTIFLTPIRSSDRDSWSGKLGSGTWPLASGRIQPRLSGEWSAAEPRAARTALGP